MSTIESSKIQTYKLKIAGAPEAEKTRDIKSPFDGRVVGTVAIPNDAAVEKALQNAASVYKATMRDVPAWKRAEILYHVAELMKQKHEDLSLTIAQEGGKPLKDARVEVTRAIQTTKMSGDEALNLNGEQITMDRSEKGENHLAMTIRESIGPILAISAFNHPVNLICHQVCTAFAAGNTVLVKPASQTQLSCFAMVELFEQAGVPQGAINVVNVSGSETTKIVRDKRIRFITFIGGEDVGWNLQKEVQPGVRIALEHGGTGTAIVTAKADLDHAIPSIVKAAFYHAGQVCVSTQNLYVHESIYDGVVEKLKTAISNLKTGDPTDAETDVGPLISHKELDRVSSWVSQAVDKGAKCLIGGKSLSDSCYEPTLLANVTSDMNVVCKEVFGPVLAIRKYSNLEETIDDINKSDYSFQGAIYTQDIDEGLFAAKRFEAKAFMINESTAFRVDWMPFGGSKASGLGVGGIKYSIHDMTEAKLIVFKSKQLS